MRYGITLAYDGTDFFGWQKQPNQISVQEELESAISKLLSGKEIDVTGCGRTDAGVHASYFVAHLDLETSIDTKQWAYKLNKMLPNSIVIFSIAEVSNEFHARFSATNRTYHYFIHYGKDPFAYNSVQQFQQLNFDAMNQAAKLLLGTQDFTSFSKLHTDVKTNICTVSKAEWVEIATNKWRFEISADRFLRNMVRAVVGTLIEVGQGKLNLEQFQAVIYAKDRSASGTSMPARGLFLCAVDYPDSILR
ncbi:MAG: tRNA pseudouridine(38-40) synthase TruA [Fluviicola sp.]